MKNKPLPIQLLLSAYRIDQLKKVSSASVLFIGRSNVGKSSLINAVTRSNAAQISKTPGKTRSVNYFSYGKKLTLIDLPGYGYAKRGQVERQQWADLMKAFFDRIKTKVLAFILMDAKRDLESEEFDLIHSLGGSGHWVKLLLTKSDRLNQSLRRQREKYLSTELTEYLKTMSITWEFVSAKTQEGIEKIRREIYQYGQGDSP